LNLTTGTILDCPGGSRAAAVCPGEPDRYRLLTNMERALIAVAIALILMGMVAPGVEAVMGCAEDCPEDFGGRCSDGTCCSYCMFVPPATLAAAVLASPSLLPCASETPSEGVARSAEGDDLLHVPKSARA
jgi:hypothetical protein